MMAEEQDMAPGAADKWKVVQLFHQAETGVPKSQALVERIERVVKPGAFQNFLGEIDDTSADACQVVFYAPRSPDQVNRLREHGFDTIDFEDALGDGEEGVLVSTYVSAALRKAEERCAQHEEGDYADAMQYVCVLLCHPLDLAASPHCGAGQQHFYLIQDTRKLLITHIVCFHQHPEGAEQPAEHAPDTASLRDSQEAVARRRRKAAKQWQGYVQVRDPLVAAVLQGLDSIPAGSMNTVLLPSESEEAESVISLYLLGGGGSRLQCPPGVDLREALGGVVVQRIENHSLYRSYSAIAVGGPDGGLDAKAGDRSGGPLPRYREDVVWHGTRLKRVDGEGTSLAAKLQSIAERGFDPSRCIKGAAAEGGIWVATSPLPSFGHGCDGLVAFVLCLAKTHFNEWVDATCARVLQRERVLPLYSLVHA